MLAQSDSSSDPEPDAPGGTPPGFADTPDCSFVRRPKWILSHVGVLLLIVAMIGAGVWQIGRHRERADRNELIEARAAEQPVDLGAVVTVTDDDSVGDAEQYRRVTVTGEYRTEDEVLIRNRTYDGAPGWWVITPLVTEDGWAVAVNRGWIPLVFEADAPRPGTEPPDGRITVTGTVQPSRRAEGLQVADPAEGRLSSLARPNVERLAAQLDYPLLPVLVQLDDDTPADAPPGEDVQPIPLSLPSLDGGPHASYAVQWFVFTTIAVIGYPLVLRRVARGGPRPAPD